jgi:RNA polymerase sigma-70 factor (ECF subfamily)
MVILSRPPIVWDGMALVLPVRRAPVATPWNDRREARRVVDRLAADPEGSDADDAVPAWPGDPVVRGAAGGGPTGFTDLYRAEQPRILAIVLSLTGDRGAAEEVVQEAFATALRRWSTVCAADRPGDWVKRVAVNNAISRFRRRGIEERSLRRVAQERGRDPAGRDRDPEHPLWAAVRRLPRRQAQVVSLVYVDDLTIERTAETLGISVGAVKNHLHRGRTTLAGLLCQEDDR